MQNIRGQINLRWNPGWHHLASRLCWDLRWNSRRRFELKRGAAWVGALVCRRAPAEPLSLSPLHPRRAEWHFSALLGLP